MSLLVSRAIQGRSVAAPVQRRGFASATHLVHKFPYLHYPPPPPREYNPDGSPKKYRLHQPVFDHGYNFEKWCLQPAGAFHSIYWAQFSSDMPARHAYLDSFPPWVAAPMVFIFLFFTTHILSNLRAIGIKPARYTPEFMEAMKERERAENCNPVTRYIDRRQAERGPHYLLSSVLPYHPYFLWMRNSHDYAAAERLIARRAKDAELREQLESEGKW